MKEIDVALTDYGLTVICLVFAWILVRSISHDRVLSIWFTILFASVGLAAAMGGTIHGFLHEDNLSHSIFWKGSLICIGVSALSAWMIGARIILSPTGQKIVSALSTVNFAIYFGYILFFNHDFLVAVVNYLPSAVFLLIAFVKIYRQTLHKLAFYAVTGLILTFIAATVQQLEIGLNDKYFGHNALYHVVQAIGLYFVFRGATFIVRSTEETLS